MTPDELVRTELARADSLRRLRENRLRLWRTAPWTAAACAAVASIARLARWPVWMPLLLLGVALAALAADALLARRARALTDETAADLDAHACLDGELRSAFWFAEHDVRDAWIDFHLARAAERLRAIDWAGLYPAPAAGRAKLATGVMAVAAIALVVLIPGGAGIAASDGHRRPSVAAAQRPGVIVALPLDLRKQLEAMLVAAEGGRGRALTAAEVRDLLARLDELGHRDAAKQAGSAAATPGERPANEADIKAFAERAKKASESTSLEPEVRDALSDMADKLGEADGNANAMASRDPEDAAAARDSGGETQQSKSGGGKQDSASVQSVTEAAGGSAAGVMMMTSDDASNARDGGLGLGGGSADRNGGGHLAELGAALRKETIEAAKDLQGENVQTERRRQTEHGNATTAYSRSAAPPAERGSSTAPPPVPESRRAAVKSYFIRKQ